MTENVERAKEAMMNISLSLGLPENYRGDLDQDLETLSKAPAGKWLWLLRTSGTVLVPLNVGVHPVYVNYWLESNHGQKVVCFMVDPQKGMLTQTSFVSAKQLIAQAPKILNASMSREELVGAVDTECEKFVLGAGRKKMVALPDAGAVLAEGEVVPGTVGKAQ